MSDSRAEFDTDPSIAAARRVENPTFQVQWPLVRSLAPEDISTALREKSPLNSTNMEDTFFWCTNPEEPLVSKTYASGTEDIGAFVIFPQEANSMKPERSYGFNETLFQVTVPSDSVIDYSTYLFIRPQDWEIVKTCRNAEEALQRLVEGGVSRAEIEEEVERKCEELLGMREEIIRFLLTPDNPLITSESLWEDFERQFVYNGRTVSGNRDWVNSQIRENLERYKHMLMIQGSREEREAELRTWQVFDPFIIEANYAESQAIVEFLRTIN